MTKDRSMGPIQVEGFLSVKDASKLLGVSIRMIYDYIYSGALPAQRIGASICVHIEAVRNYQRTAVGRPRTHTPIWRKPVPQNLQHVSQIHARIREGQGEMLERRLEEIRAAGLHHIAGTVARYFVRNQVNPDLISLILV